MSLVDIEFYLDNNPDIKSTDTDCTLHYHTFGFLENRKPNLYFDFDFYLFQIEQCEEVNVKPTSEDDLLLHYEKIGWKYELTPSVYFNPQYYKEEYNIKEGNPFLDFVRSKEMRSPHPLISINYVYQNNDLISAKGNNIIEKIFNFQLNGKNYNLKTSDFFDTTWYINHYGINTMPPLFHLLRFGIYERRNPHRQYVIDYRGPKSKIKPVNCFNYLTKIKQVAEPDPNKTVFSIVILNWNRAITTIQCVNNLYEITSSDLKYEIIVVDNGSEPEDYRLLFKHLNRKCEIIRLNTNRFFGEANNIGVEKSKGSYVVFLNNDAFPQAKWLTILYDVYSTTPEAGCVGPMFLFPDGRVQECGGVISLCGQIIQRGKGLETNEVNFSRLTDVDYVSAATVLISKKLFTSIGGFDFMYEPAYYEDTDLCMKIKASGKKVVFTDRTSVIHVENFTSKDPNIGFEFMPNVIKNRKKFVNRWQKLSNPTLNLFNLPRDIVLDKTFSCNQTDAMAIIYSPYQIVPGGGERYILSLAIALVKHGYITYFATPEIYSKIRLLNVGHDLRLDLNYLNEIKFISIAERDNLDKPDLFISMGNEAIPNHPPIGIHNIYHCQFPFKITDHGLYSQNAKFLAQYDMVIVNSQFTSLNLAKEFITSGFTETPPIKILYPPVSLKKKKSVVQKKQAILSVGRFISDGHHKRQDILIEAFKQLFDKYKNEELELHLVGASYPEQKHQQYLTTIINRAKGYPIRFHVDASSKTLLELYNQCNIYWHATGFGKSPIHEAEKMEHFGITVVEAMNNYLIPIVYNGGGPKEILGSKEHHLYSTIEELVDKTMLVLENEKDYSKEEMYDKSLLYDEEKFFSRAQNIIESILNNQALIE